MTVARVFFGLMSAYLLLAAKVSFATPIIFDFESEFATAVPRTGAYSSLSITKSGLKADISRPGGRFDIVQNVGPDQVKSSSFGSKSLDPFFQETRNTPFVINFSSPISRANVEMGDYGQDSPDTLILRAYSQPNASGNLIDSSRRKLFTNPSSPFAFRSRELVVSGDSIRSLELIGGSSSFPNSVFYDNIQARRSLPNAIELSKTQRLGLLYIGINNRLPLYYAALGPLAAACPVTATATCFVLGTGVFAATAFESYQLFNIVFDPPDPEYTQIFTPRTYSPISVDLTPEVPEDLILAANVLFGSRAELYSLLEAWRVTLERYQAALLAGDQAAAFVQENALNSYVQSASEQAELIHLLHEVFVDKLQQFIGPITVPVTEIETVIDNLIQNGFGQEELELFESFGLSPVNIDNLLGIMTDLDIASVPNDFFYALNSNTEDFGEFSDLSDCVAASCSRLVSVSEPDQIGIFLLGVLFIILASSKIDYLSRAIVRTLATAHWVGESRKDPRHR